MIIFKVANKDDKNFEYFTSIPNAQTFAQAMALKEKETYFISAHFADDKSYLQEMSTFVYDDETKDAKQIFPETFKDFIDV